MNSVEVSNCPICVQQVGIAIYLMDLINHHARTLHNIKLTTPYIHIYICQSLYTEVVYFLKYNVNRP